MRNKVRQMKKMIKIIVRITVLCSIGICFHACGKDVQENKAIEVYRVPYEEFDCDYKEGDYLAIEKSGETLYIPDCYGEILNVSVNESCIIIRHRDLVDNQIKENTIPIIFLPDETNNVLEITAGKDKRVLVSSDTEKLPLSIWSEEFFWENKLYKVTFERTSLVYSGLFFENGDLLADYGIKVFDENGDLIAEQVLTNYPVRYEDMHWLIDFSGDGFPDLAFCTEYILAKFSSTTTHFLIWNMETSSYQPEIFPKQEVYEEVMFRPLWNTELSAVLFFAGSDIEDRIIMLMYAYADSEWKIIRRLAPVYEGNEDEQNETSAYIGYQEIFYDDNEIISRHMVEFEGINAIWFDTGSVWCKDNVTNIQLYPGEEWQEITIQEEGMTFVKYVRCRK
ncbi:MAG: hypothetical protein HDR11_12010 [Lachnospiraceae bacterium]|nr:hypothetical protein [Lachnospiraceae bacterium]